METRNSLTTHQKAVNALLEVAVFTPELLAATNAELAVPRQAVPALFRAAIEEKHGEETAIIKHALALLEQAPDGERTPEQEEFFAALAFECEGEQIFRVKYSPQNVTVN